MSCDAFQAFILDEALGKPAGFDAHVAACPACQSLKQGHRAAQRLSGLSPARASRRPLSAVQRRASLVGAVLLVVGGASGLWALDGPAPAPGEAHPAVPVAHAPAAFPLEGPVPVVASDEAASADAEWAGLLALRDGLARDLSRDLRDDEVLSRSFGALPAWVAPTKTYPMRGLGAAAPHLTYTSED